MKKLNRLIPILCFLLIIPLAFAEDQAWVYDREYLILDVDISSDVLIKPTSSDFIIEEFITEISFFPRDTDQQDVLKLEFNPRATLKEEHVLFEMVNPEVELQGSNFNFLIKGEVKTYNEFKQVKEKIPYPIAEIPSEFYKYTKPQPIIDSDHLSISNLASSLAQGEDDLFKVVHKAAVWVNKNIEYELNTITADASQKASWVLENKQGVCDEITSLFIALVRNLGIPARFISGISYTDSDLFDEKWGPHGWAEVYFPGYGWVPFDITYGEFGYIDPSHIVLKITTDAKTSSSHFEWRALDVDVKPSSLKTETRITNRGPEVKEIIELSSRPVMASVGFGSYNVIETELVNKKDYYVAMKILLSKVKEMEILLNDYQEILLEPGETRKIHWIVKIDDNLDDKYIYSFPINVYSIRNEMSSTFFNSSSEERVLSLSQAQKLVSQLVEEKKKTYSKEVNLDCISDKELYYEYETAEIECKIKNTGNIILQNLNVCVSAGEKDSACTKTNLNINQEQEFGFSVNLTKKSSKTLIASAENSEVTKTQQLTLEVLDIPKISVSSLEFPETVKFDDVFKINFFMVKDSLTNPIDVEIRLFQGSTSKRWLLNELEENRKMEIDMKGSNLVEGNNNMKVLINFKDKNEKEYSVEEKFTIKLENVTFPQKMVLFFNSVGRFVKGLFE